MNERPYKNSEKRSVLDIDTTTTLEHVSGDILRDPEISSGSRRGEERQHIIRDPKHDLNGRGHKSLENVGVGIKELDLVNLIEFQEIEDSGRGNPVEGEGAPVESNTRFDRLQE